MTFVKRSQRQYQALLSVNAGKRLGVALAVVNPDKSCQIASGAYKWHEIAPFLPKIDLFLGVYRGDREYAQALELCERAREFGCDAAEV